MIIFSGFGILIPVFFFIGFVPVMLICTAIRMDFIKSLALSSWAGAAMIWLFAKTIGRPKQQHLYDPQTRQPVTLVSSHTIFFMSGKVWAVIVSLFALFLTVESWRGKGSFPLLVDVVESSRRAAPFYAAHNRLSSPGAEDSGNSEEATQMAESASKALKAIRVMSSDDDGKAHSLKGQFVTHCQLSREACVFLVYAPEFASRSPDEQAVIIDAAWAMAQAQVAEIKPAPAQLAVAVRGATHRYSSVWIGVPAPLSPDGVAAGVRDRLSDSGKEQLYKFFTSEEDQKPKPMVKSQEDRKAAPPAQQVAEKSDAKKAEANKPVDSTARSPELLAATLPTAERDWKSTDGRPLRAVLLRVTNEAGGSGVFRRADGQEFTIPIDRFIAEDQALLKMFGAAGVE